MSRTKDTHSKKIKVATKKTSVENTDGEIEEIAPKILAKAIPLIGFDEVPVVLDEKIDEDAATVEEEAEELSDDSTLDDDELNPFGDKWEK